MPAKAFNQNPLEDFNNIIYWQQLVMKFLGADAYGTEFRYSHNTILLVLLATSFMITSIIDLYLFRDDLFNFVFVLTTLCYGVIGCERLLFLLTKPEKASSLVVEAIQTYNIASSDVREQKILWRYNKILKQCVLFFTISFKGGVVLAETLPLLVYLLTGEKILPCGVVLPFTDPKTPDGYQLNYMYQVSLMLWASPGLTATQNMYFALVFNICIQYDLLISKLQDLDRFIVENEGELGHRAVRDKLVEIIKLQQRLISFITDLEELFAIQAFIEVSTNAFQITVTLFVLNNAVWLPGYLVVFVTTLLLFITCMLGTLIEIKTESLTENIYNVSWHEMDVSNQKMLKFILLKSQRSLKLTFGGMIPLNMNLFLSVYRKIYSIFMMLQNM